MRRSTQTLGSLTCHIIDVGEGPPQALVVLAHGFGASGEDLVGLASAMVAAAKLSAPVRFIFPEAPLDLSAQHMPGARAWWHLDMAMLHLRNRDPAGCAEELRNGTYDGMPAARRMLHKAVTEALTITSLGFDRLILGGFSQGAMVTTDLTLMLDEPPAGLIVLSGTLVDQKRWRQLAAKRRGLPVVQSHGRKDEILPFENAEALRDLLQNAGWPVEFHAFGAGHTIHGEAVRMCTRLIEGVLSKT